MTGFSKTDIVKSVKFDFTFFCIFTKGKDDMYKIVADSSSNIKNSAVVSVPLTVGTDEREFVDNDSFNVHEMVEYLSNYKGRSGSACPASEDWLSAFGDAQYVFCIAITSNLSGSYNSARIAKDEYEETYPNRKVCVIDSLSTAGEMELIAEKIQELIDEGKDFDTICAEIAEYQKKTHLLFCLKSLTNLANNGRVSTAAAKISSILNLRIVGKASDVGTLEMLSKPRGDKNAHIEILSRMKEFGYNGGKVIIGHCLALDAAKSLSALIKSEFANAKIKINECGALCTFYAENGGLLIGYEG